MPAQKKSAKKQPATKKKASAKQPASKAPAKKAAAKKTSAKKAPASEAAPEKVESAAKPATKKGGVSSTQVMMGHLFSLRPRVSTAFKPDDFRRARQVLESESFESLEKAARAVAEKALDLTREVVSTNRREKRR